MDWNKATNFSQIGSFFVAVIALAYMVWPRALPPSASSPEPVQGATVVTNWVAPLVLASCVLLAGVCHVVAAYILRNQKTTNQKHNPMIALDGKNSSMSPEIPEGDGGFALKETSDKFVHSNDHEGAALSRPGDLLIIPSAASRPLFDATAERIMADLSAESLAGIYANHTTRESKQLLKTYIGKWLRLEGAIVDIDISDKGTSIELHGKRRLLEIMWFDNEWDGRLSTAKAGDFLTVLGRIFDVGPTAIQLDHCEIYKPAKAEIIKRLSDFAEEGNLLLQRDKEKTEPGWPKARNWATRVVGYIQQNLDEASAAYFALSTSPELYPGGAVDRAFVDWMYTRIKRLDTLASEVRLRAG